MKTLARLLAFLRPFASWTALSVLLGVATIAGGIGLFGTSAYLIAAAALHPSVAALQVAIVGVRFFGISRAAFRYLERLVSHSVNFRLLAGLRVWFYDRIEPLAPAVLQGYHSADLLGRVIADIETLENFYVRAVAPPLVALVITAGAGWFVGLADPRLALALVSALLAAGLGLPLMAYLLNRSNGRALVEQRSRLNGRVLELVQGMPELLVYGRSLEALARIDTAGRAVGRAQRYSALAGALAGALSQFVTGLALWGVLVIAIPLVSARIDGVRLAVLALVALASFEAVTPLAQAAQHLESSLHAARRLFALAGAQPQGTPPPDPLPAPASADICIRGLTFSYAGNLPQALRGLNLDLPLGHHVALVGESGAGKTSLINLLLRFWDYQQGEILFGGQDLRNYDPEDIRRCFAVVEQKPYLFSSTLRHNLLLARPDASPEDLERVITLSGLEDVIARLPDGLNTWTGERGVQLSGGERQRVAIARAMLSDAPVLLLDEPTTGLDAASERQVISAIQLAAAGRSIVWITHRLAGLDTMDEIVVLRQGQVVERGTHAQLLSAGGLYAQLWQIQEQSLA